MAHLIVLVSPDAMLQALIGVTLDGNLAHVRSATTVDEALNILADNDVDLLLFDVGQFPVLDRRLCHQPLRQDPTRTIPVVVLAPQVTEATRESCLTLGAVDVLERPFSPLKLLATVERVLGMPELGPPPSPMPVAALSGLATPAPVKGEFTLRRVAVLVAVMVLLSSVSSAAVLWWHEQSTRRVDQAAVDSLPAVIAQSRPFVVLLAASDATSTGLGTGVIFDASGRVVTNSHVVEGRSRVDVVLSDHTVRPGRVMGASQSPDLAVVQIEGEGTFPVARFSDRVQAGERVAVLGYPLTFALGLDAGAFVGVVSKQTAGVDGRYLQVDVAVNPGMSGAPLLNADGDMVGLVTSRVEVVNGRNVLDVALAIPSNTLTVALPGLTTGYREQSVASVAAPAAPSAAVQEFIRLLRTGEAGMAYHWLSSRAQATMPEIRFLALLGYADGTSLLAGPTRVVTETDTTATVSMDVLVSRPESGVVQSRWQTELWQLVKTPAGWRLDERTSVQQAPQ